LKPIPHHGDIDELSLKSPSSKGHR